MGSSPAVPGCGSATGRSRALPTASAPGRRSARRRAALRWPRWPTAPRRSARSWGRVCGLLGNSLGRPTGRFCGSIRRARVHPVLDRHHILWFIGCPTQGVGAALLRGDPAAPSAVIWPGSPRLALHRPRRHEEPERGGAPLSVSGGKGRSHPSTAGCRHAASAARARASFPASVFDLRGLRAGVLLAPHRSISFPPPPPPPAALARVARPLAPEIHPP